MRKHKGFTLVELLVVIGIIALLISILLPVLNKAREQAARVKCQSNMRSLMQAVHLYASENNAQSPFCNWVDTVDDTGNRYQFGWLFTSPSPNGSGIRLGLGGNLDGNWGNMPPTDGVKTGVLWPYVKQVGVYHCPMDSANGQVEPWVGTHWMTSYTMDGAQCGYGKLGNKTANPPSLNNPGLKLTQIRRSAECVLLWELKDSSWNDGASGPTEANFATSFANRHYQGADIAYVDGHVDWWDGQTYLNYASDANNPNALYWYPFTSSGR